MTLQNENPNVLSFPEAVKQAADGKIKLEDWTKAQEDKINPPHYKHLPVECIEITEHMSFCLGNVIKYIYRCNLKGGVHDLRKARWYLDREIARREGETIDVGC